MPYALKDEDQKDEILAAYERMEESQNNNNLGAYGICTKML